METPLAQASDCNDPFSPDLYGMYLLEAQGMIKKYKELSGLPTMAFTVHAEDLLQALGYSEYQIGQIFNAFPLRYPHARMYLGALTAVNEDTEKETISELKLFLVPVAGASIDGPEHEQAGTDVIPCGPFTNRLTESVETGEHVFDLIAPCPGTCDLNSPLYNLPVK